MGCTWKGSLSGWEWSERTEGTLQFAPSWGISQNNRRVAIERCEADGSNSELHSGHHAGPAARPYCAQILMGIHRGVLDADFIVKVRAQDTPVNPHKYLRTVWARSGTGVMTRM